MADERPDHDTGHMPDPPFVVEVAAARDRHRSPRNVASVVAVVAVVVALSAWGLAVAPGAPPTQPPPAAPSVAPSVAQPAVAPPSLGLPTDDGAGLPSVTAPADDDAFASLAAAGGWPVCPMWRGFGDGSTLTRDVVVAQLARTPQPDGMYRVVDAAGRTQRVWVAADPDDAARGFGGSAVVRVAGEGDSIWTGVPSGTAWTALRLEAVGSVRPGRLAWQARESATPAPYCIFASSGGQPAAVVRVPATADPVRRLMTLEGWSHCRTWERLGSRGQPSAEAIDAVADAGGFGAGPGWLRVPVPGALTARDEPVWIGDDAAAAGTRHGTRTVVIAGDGSVRQAWMAMRLDGRPLAVGFDLVRTPGGREAWVPTSDAAGVTGDCELEGGAAVASPRPA